MKPMIKTLTWTGILVVGLIITSCSTSTDAPTLSGYPAPPASTEAPTTPGYPGYPAPSASTPATSSSSAYPGSEVLPSPSAEIPEVTPEAPIPSSGKASIAGVLYSYTALRIIRGTPFYLTRASGSDQRALPPLILGPNDRIGDILGQSDAKGEFIVNDLSPGNYYLIVSAPLNWVVAESPPGNTAPLLIELMADQQVSLGVVYLSWP